MGMVNVIININDNNIHRGCIDRLVCIYNVTKNTTINNKTNSIYIIKTRFTYFSFDLKYQKANINIKNVELIPLMQGIIDLIK